MIASRGAISGCQRWVPDCLPHQLKRRNPWLLKMGSNLGRIWVESGSQSGFTSSVSRPVIQLDMEGEDSK